MPSKTVAPVCKQIGDTKQRDAGITTTGVSFGGSVISIIISLVHIGN